MLSSFVSEYAALLEVHFEVTSSFVLEEVIVIEMQVQDLTYSQHKYIFTVPPNIVNIDDLSFFFSDICHNIGIGRLKNLGDHLKVT